MRYLVSALEVGIIEGLRVEHVPALGCRLLLLLLVLKLSLLQGVEPMRYIITRT